MESLGPDMAFLSELGNMFKAKLDSFQELLNEANTDNEKEKLSQNSKKTQDILQTLVKVAKHHEIEKDLTGMLQSAKTDIEKAQEEFLLLILPQRLP